MLSKVYMTIGKVHLAGRVQLRSRGSSLNIPMPKPGNGILNAQGLD